MWKARRRSSSRNQLRRTLKLQPLEERTPLAGDVLAALAGSNLHVDGDALGNEIEIDQAGLAADEYRITGIGTTTINGGAAPVVISGVTGNIKVDLGDGDNELFVEDAAVPGNVDVETGDGDDLVQMEDVVIGGNLDIDTGDGLYQVNLRVDVDGNVKVSNDDGGSTFFFFFFGTNIFDSTIGGNLQIKNKDGFDGVQIVDSVVDGNVKIDNGQGALVDLGGGDEGFFGGFVGIGDVGIGGNLEIKNKDGIDQTFLEETVVAGNVNLDYGDGGVFLEDSIDESFLGGLTFIGDVSVGGNLDIKNKDGFDVLQMFATTVDGNMKVDNGDGGLNAGIFGTNDGSVTLMGGVTVGGNLDIKTKDGADVILMDTVSVAGNTKIKTGDDDDEVRVIDSFFAKFSADGGKGDDLFEDAGGNTFVGGAKLKKFETIL